jgi:hypothetical protein
MQERAQQISHPDRDNTAFSTQERTRFTNQGYTLRTLTSQLITIGFDSTTPPEIATGNIEVARVFIDGYEKVRSFEKFVRQARMNPSLPSHVSPSDREDMLAKVRNQEKKLFEKATDETNPRTLAPIAAQIGKMADIAKKLSGNAPLDKQETVEDLKFSFERANRSVTGLLETLNPAEKPSAQQSKQPAPDQSKSSWFNFRRKGPDSKDQSGLQHG